MRRSRRASDILQTICKVLGNGWRSLRSGQSFGLVPLFINESRNQLQQRLMLWTVSLR